MILQIACPEAGCPAPADVGERWEFASTDGRIGYARTTCALGHAFTVPEADLVGVTPAEPRYGAIRGTARLGSADPGRRQEPGA